MSSTSPDVDSTDSKPSSMSLNLESPPFYPGLKKIPLSSPSDDAKPAFVFSTNPSSFSPFSDSSNVVKNKSPSDLPTFSSFFVPTSLTTDSKTASIFTTTTTTTKTTTTTAPITKTTTPSVNPSLFFTNTTVKAANEDAPNSLSTTTKSATKVATLFANEVKINDPCQKVNDACVPAPIKFGASSFPAFPSLSAPVFLKSPETKLEKPASTPTPSPQKPVQLVFNTNKAEEVAPVPNKDVDALAASLQANVNISNEMLFSGLTEDHFKSEDIVITLANLNQTFTPVKTFEELNLSPGLQKGIYAMNFRRPSKIQQCALPLLLADPPANMIAQSQSGTGKTAAFVLAMLHRVDPTLKRIQAICLTNTRELATQIHTVVRGMSSETGIKSNLSVSKMQRAARLHVINNSQVIVGTPGSLHNLVAQDESAFTDVRILVLDEADTMLHEGSFTKDINAVRRCVDISNKRKQLQSQQGNFALDSPTIGTQFLLFSATFNAQMSLYADVFAPNSNRLMLPDERVKVDSIRQFYVRLNEKQKVQRLMDLYGLLTVGQSIVFVQRKNTGAEVAHAMTKDGFTVSCLSSLLDADERDDLMQKFRTGETQVLIATNVLSRGIDVPQVNLVVNFDMPTDERGLPDCETYVHRVGRTGRFGRSGVSINFISDEFAFRVQEKIIKTYGMKIIEMPDDLEQMELIIRKSK